MRFIDLLNTIRININDRENIEFYDTDILLAVNQTIMDISVLIAKKGYYLTKTYTTINLSSGIGYLPDDFLKDIKVYEDVKYEIFGNKINIDNDSLDSITLFYYKKLPIFTSTTDEQDIPDVLFNLIVYYTSAILLNIALQNNSFIASIFEMLDNVLSFNSSVGKKITINVFEGNL